MESSSYLFMSKRKRHFSYRIMEKHSSSDSNISIDSLEKVFKKEKHHKGASSGENVETILVPFYENDVLIKVPKDHKKKQKHEKTGKVRRDFQIPDSYLIRKDVKKVKRTTYLEMFRKQFGPTNVEKVKDEREIRSISPEYGDTERESVFDVDHNSATEFYNTEAYNEMYYEKILNQDIEDCFENSFEECLRLTDNMTSKSPDDSANNNLRSISEVSQPRRQRRATVQPIQNIKLGGLGPDIEKIRPRLERARSLQRYSEKVRMENRLRIYKKSLQADMEKKAERETSAKRRSSAKEISKDNDQNVSYLINKAVDDTSSNAVKTIYAKSKSAGVQRTRGRNKEKDLIKDERSKNHNKKESVVEKEDKTKKLRSKTPSRIDKDRKPVETNNVSKYKSVRYSARNRGINTENDMTGDEILPVQIRFSVEVGGLRHSNALRSLEEKHKMFQEQVKGFTMDSNNI